MHLVDTHCHLNFDPLADGLDQVLGRAGTAGVTTIVVPSYDLASWPVVAELAAGQGIFGAFGLHPWKANENFEVSALGDLLTRAVAVGEIGLDFKIDGPSGFRRRQIEVFEAQVELAVDFGLPVILHCRGAFEEMFTVLGRFAPGLTGVIHAYSRGTELARRCLEQGLHLGFGGAVTRPRARRARRSAVLAPAERIVLETDAPAIGLEGVEVGESEPCHVLEVARAMADLRGVALADIARQTTGNAAELFGLPNVLAND